MIATTTTAALIAALLLPVPTDDDFEGCTPGYWKNHVERWDGIGQDEITITVHAGANFNAFFDVTQAQSGLADVMTLVEAADIGGGGVVALNRHAAAGAASADAGIDYEFTLNEVIDIYRDGVGADAGPLSVDQAKTLLENANEAGCPLNNDDPDVTPYCFGDQGDCPCGEFQGGGCLNTAGQGALLAASGSTSVAADDLVLTTTQLPANAFALTFMGVQGATTAFGNGRLCVSSPGSKLFRYTPAQNSGAAGSMQLGAGIVAFSANYAVYGGEIHPGSTWYFQTYYRDTGGCQAGYNLSNALRIDFQP